MASVYEKPNMRDQSNPPPYTPGLQPPIQQAPTVVHATVVPTMVPTMVSMVVTQQMSSKPSAIRCKSCHLEIVTRVEMKSTTKTHLFAALLCVIGCWPCVCVPYCVDSCKSIDHYCPNCNAYIGTHFN